MKRLSWIGLVGGLIGAATAFGADDQATESTEKPTVRLGHSAPPINLEEWAQLPEGASGYDWDDLRGRTVVLEFWATWCGPCLAAVPHMNELATEFKDEVVFIAITDEAEEKTRRVRERIPMRSVLGFDTDKSMHRDYAVRAIPRTIVVDDKGFVAAITHPNQLTSERLQRYIDGYRDQPEAPAGGGSDRANRTYQIIAGVDPLLDVEEPLLTNAQFILRPSTGVATGSSTSGGNRDTLLNVTPTQLIAHVYDVQAWQVRMPEGGDEEKRYDLIVDLPPEVVDDGRTLVQQLVLRSLRLDVEERREPLDGYALVELESGVTLKASPADNEMGYRSSGFRISSPSMSLRTLARLLQGQLGAPVTAAEVPRDLYQMDLHWPADVSLRDANVVRRGLEMQSGLTLEPRAVERKVIVVRPAE